MMINLYRYFYLKIINTNDTSLIQRFTMEINDHYIVELVNCAALEPIQRRVLPFHLSKSMHKDRSNLTTKEMMCKSSRVRNQSESDTPTNTLDPLSQPYRVMKIESRQGMPPSGQRQNHSVMNAAKFPSSFPPSLSLLSNPNTFPTPSASAIQHTVKYSSPIRATSASQELMGDI